MNKLIYINVLILLALAVISIPSLASSATGINMNALPSGFKNLPSSTQNLLIANNDNVSLNALTAPTPSGSTDPNFTPVYYLPNGTTTTTPPWLKKDYKSAVTLEVQYLKSKGMDDAQIVETMRALNITYYPDTGDWYQIAPAPSQAEINLANQQLSSMNKIIYNNSSVKAQTNTVQTVSPLDVTNIENWNGLWTNYGWSGFNYNMKTGVMGVDTGSDYGTYGIKGTNTQYVTTHLGNGYCTEIGVAAFSSQPSGNMNVYVYDTNLGGYISITWINNQPNTYNAYMIYEAPNKDGTGLYQYSVYFNGQLKLQGHLLTTSNQLSQCKEIFTINQPGAYYTLDGSASNFQQQYVYYVQNGVSSSMSWNSYVYTYSNPSHDPPQVSLSYSLQGNPQSYSDTLQDTGSFT